MALRKIKTMSDAKHISENILRSFYGMELEFNPLQGRIFRFEDGGFCFRGEVLNEEQALERIAIELWNNRNKVNKQIKMFERMGPDFINCGC